PSNATHLAVGTTGTDGDADLYVRHERLPDTGSSACKSTSPFATESCTVERPAAGNWYVLIDAFTAYSGLTLRASFATGGSIALDVTGLPGDVEADVMVTGPGGHAERVRSSDTLSALVPGLYSVTAAYVQDGSAVYAGTPETQTVDV